VYSSSTVDDEADARLAASGSKRSERREEGNMAVRGGEARLRFEG
jgi:hypothetical protein